MRVGDEVLCEIDEPVETCSNGVRHAKVPDPEGNAIALAEPPDAASA